MTTKKQSLKAKKLQRPSLAREEQKNVYQDTLINQTFGRPTKLTNELLERICELIETTPKGLQAIISENDWMPDTATIRRWVRGNQDFCARYAQAKQKQIETHINHTLIIGDEVAVLLDTVHPQKAGAYVQAAKLRIESRHKYAEMLEPSKYGVKAKIEGQDDKNNLSNMTPEEAAMRVSTVFAQAMQRKEPAVKKAKKNAV